MVASSFLALVLSMMWSQSKGWGQMECWDWSGQSVPCHDINTGAPGETHCFDPSGREHPCGQSVWTISTTADTSTSYDESPLWQNPVFWIIGLGLLIGIPFICWAITQPTLVRVEASQVAAEARVPGRAEC